ncbi:centrosomal protein of 295 kDa-like isoform X3 [Pelodiscus sinensis]|uniref:centrosomal protein of 295 kDa-like isoform X3 n=1 Tax=Pelodiscus sinensis TaxID=13735 RepID=UPI003F6D71A6
MGREFLPLNPEADYSVSMLSDCSAIAQTPNEDQSVTPICRLYNQLAEVKSRKEEKSRQETYAKNREKAKEFQKKTLEKLRAKKTP